VKYFLLFAACSAFAAEVKSLEIRILSTMLADTAGIGEWGFSAVVIADGRTILFDTGARPDTVLKNARELKVDLRGIAEVILSHNHTDHTGGLVTLRREYPKALGHAHVAPGIFRNSMVQTKAEYEALGGKFTEHPEFTQIAPGVWLTGPVPRPHDERNWSTAGNQPEDNIPEDMSMVIQTAQGLVLISGCGHAGLINTIDYAQKKLGSKPILAAIGGFHLFPASDLHLDWTAAKLKAIGLVNFIGAHCTGIEATYRIRERVGLDRRHAVVGAVGTGFRLGEGILPGTIAR
jgi:7,8-dihydropterin-6-yl-methyl-4-(beta-D-ribofuranosyl)aminobenzene 5'-phosphate synthase